jgi:hypothetical protein
LLTLVLHFNLRHFDHVNLVSHVFEALLLASHDAHCLLVLHDEFELQLSLFVNQFLLLNQQLLALASILFEQLFLVLLQCIVVLPDRYPFILRLNCVALDVANNFAHVEAVQIGQVREQLLLGCSRKQIKSVQTVFFKVIRRALPLHRQNATFPSKLCELTLVHCLG